MKAFNYVWFVVTVAAIYVACGYDYNETVVVEPPSQDGGTPHDPAHCCDKHHGLHHHPEHCK